jgi:prepilin-type N-terminal cleavage/methylation domain-containing protein
MTPMLIIKKLRTKFKNKLARGFTFIELMVVLAIFTFLFVAILTMLTSSDRSFRVGQNKLIEQQEARKAMDNMARLLRQTNPDWIVNEVHYPLTISSNNKRIDFYNPVFLDDGTISYLKKITFKLNPDNLRQLLKREGTSDAVVIGNEVEDISFGCVAGNCSAINIQIKTKKNTETEFSLISQITPRNQNVTLSKGVVVEQPQEGEF